jgi:FKBP-type peptidyl-prolyl cis-trans isomerase FkpA
MQKGGKYKIHIPGALAYGENPPPGSPFGKNADLDFDVHIVQIVPNAALMQQQGGQAPGGEVPGGEIPGGQPQQAPQPETAPTP